MNQTYRNIIFISLGLFLPGSFCNCDSNSNDSNDALMQKALLAISERDYDSAAVSLEEILNQDSANTRAQILLQKSYYFQKKYKPAILLGDSILADEPNNIGALVYTSLGHIHLGSPEDMKMAQDLLETALQINPDNLDAWCARGLLFEKKGDTAQAIASYSAAIHKGGTLAQAHLRLGVLYKNFEMSQKSKLHYSLARLVASGVSLDPIEKDAIDSMQAEEDPGPAKQEDKQ